MPEPAKCEANVMDKVDQLAPARTLAGELHLLPWPEVHVHWFQVAAKQSPCASAERRDRDIEINGLLFC